MTSRELPSSNGNHHRDEVSLLAWLRDVADQNVPEAFGRRGPGGLDRADLHRRPAGPHPVPAPAAGELPHGAAGRVRDRREVLRRRVRPQRSRITAGTATPTSSSTSRSPATAASPTCSTKPNARTGDSSPSSASRSNGSPGSATSARRSSTSWSRPASRCSPPTKASTPRSRPRPAASAPKRATPTLTRRVKQAIAEWYVLNMLELSWDGLKEHTDRAATSASRPTATSPNGIPIRSKPSATTARSSTASSPTRSAARWSPRSSSGGRWNGSATRTSPTGSTPTPTGIRRRSPIPGEGRRARRRLDRRQRARRPRQPQAHRLHGLEPAQAPAAERARHRQGQPAQRMGLVAAPTHEPLVTRDDLRRGQHRSPGSAKAPAPAPAPTSTPADRTHLPAALLRALRPVRPPRLRQHQGLHVLPVHPERQEPRPPAMVRATPAPPGPRGQLSNRWRGSSPYASSDATARSSSPLRPTPPKHKRPRLV